MIRIATMKIAILHKNSIMLIMMLRKDGKQEKRKILEIESFSIGFVGSINQID